MGRGLDETKKRDKKRRSEEWNGLCERVVVDGIFWLVLLSNSGNSSNDDDTQFSFLSLVKTQQ